MSCPYLCLEGVMMACVRGEVTTMSKEGSWMGCKCCQTIQRTILVGPLRSFLSHMLFVMMLTFYKHVQMHNVGAKMNLGLNGVWRYVEDSELPYTLTSAMRVQEPVRDGNICPGNYVCGRRYHCVRHFGCARSVPCLLMAWTSHSCSVAHLPHLDPGSIANMCTLLCSRGLT